ncbi:MAG: GNAT family N-acetyltransferase [Proteobacteria bacterium]|nr:GNAT family N-acetyltransferase [Pseudomonadota bacterium]
MSLSIDTVADLAALDALREDWAALWAQDPVVTPFGHPAWLLPWARTHAPDRTEAVALRRDGTLIALAPVFTWNGALLLAGTGPSDYGEALFGPEAARCADVLLEVLAERAAASGCRLDLQQLRPENPLAAALPPAGWRETAERGEVCPVALVVGPDGVGAMPGKWRRKLGYTRHRALDEGGWTSERAGAETLEEIAGALLQLHAQRWRSRGEGGVFEDDLLVRLVRQALPELETAGLLRLHALRHAGRIGAVVLALEGKGALHFFISGFDPALTDLGPGTLLLGDMVGEAAAEGLGELRFLRGQERYKYHWGAQDRPTLRRVFERA